MFAWSIRIQIDSVFNDEPGFAVTGVVPDQEHYTGCTRGHLTGTGYLYAASSRSFGTCYCFGYAW
jgi:hypothetical protein